MADTHRARYGGEGRLGASGPLSVHHLLSVSVCSPTQKRPESCHLVVGMDISNHWPLITELTGNDGTESSKPLIMLLIWG